MRIVQRFWVCAGSFEISDNKNWRFDVEEGDIAVTNEKRSVCIEGIEQKHTILITY